MKSMVYLIYDWYNCLVYNNQLTATIKVGKTSSPLKDRILLAQSSGGKIPLCESMMGREKSQNKSQVGIQNKARARGHNGNIFQSPSKCFFSKMNRHFSIRWQCCCSDGAHKQLITCDFHVSGVKGLHGFYLYKNTIYVPWAAA